MKKIFRPAAKKTNVEVFRKNEEAFTQHY